MPAALPLSQLLLISPSSSHCHHEFYHSLSMISPYFSSTCLIDVEFMPEIENRLQLTSGQHYHISSPDGVDDICYSYIMPCYSQAISGRVAGRTGRPKLTEHIKQSCTTIRTKRETSKTTQINKTTNTYKLTNYKTIRITKQYKLQNNTN